MTPVTFMDRVKAAAIIKKLRDQNNCETVAKLFNTRKAYISMAEYNTKRLKFSIMENGRKRFVYEENQYLCPHGVIRRILEWGEKNA